MIKTGTEATGKFSEKDEADFILFLGHELEKVISRLF
jgi:SPX domain protein involved in polyphosphate accumulation